MIVSRFRDIVVHTADTENLRRKALEARRRVYLAECGKLTGTVEDAFDREATLLVAMRAGQVTGSIRLVWSDRVQAFELEGFFDLSREARSVAVEVNRFAVVASARRGATALALIRAAWQVAAHHRAQWCYAVTTLELLRFYEHIGFERVGDTSVPYLPLGGQEHAALRIRIKPGETIGPMR